MKKILGFTVGGLQHKTWHLILVMLLLVIASFAGISVYHNKMLVQVVEKARKDQQESISQTSERSMHQQLENSLVNTTALQAEMADNDFSEVINDICIMQTMAQGLFENQDLIEPGTVNPPDPSLDGTPTVHVLFEEGVDYTKSEYLGIVAHMGELLLALDRNSTKIASCYVGLADGTHLSVDAHLANRFDENGRQIPYPVRDRPWYKGAVETRGLFFTGIEKDAFSGEIGITCSAPVFYQGEIVAVVGADINLDSINNFVHTSNERSGYSFVINDHGQVILAPDDNPIFAVATADEAPDLRLSDNKELATFIDKALEARTRLTDITINHRRFYMAGAPMKTMGWAVIKLVERAVTEEPERLLQARFASINADASAVFYQGTSRVRLTIFLMIAVIMVIGTLAAHFGAGRIVRPIEEMTRNIVESGKTGRPFEMKPCYRTNDEIEVLAESFDDLFHKIQQYITDITAITREKERISTELDLARKIQADMMPYIYPAFPDRNEFDIYATMNPAKEVGGDFYDFFLIDRDHLGMVVADVSGKGVPAALFMMMAKILINNFAMMGILDIPTGRLIAANAGHEYPIIRKGSQGFRLLKDKHGFVLGGYEGMPYKDYEIQLNRGDLLFLYTDGVPEAANEKDELFGTKRLIETMNRYQSCGPFELLTAVRNSVNDFVGDAEPFDDLTMLAITMK